MMSNLSQQNTISCGFQSNCKAQTKQWKQKSHFLYIKQNYITQSIFQKLPNQYFKNSEKKIGAKVV